MTDTPTLQRARKIFALLAEAGSLPVAEREELLAGSEPDLAAEVRALLEVEAMSGGGLTTGPLEERFDLETLFGEDRLPAGTAVGQYEVLELLGAGGMGQVYLAQQEEPIRRRVALKTLRGSLASEQARMRFVAERHAMGRLDHPNIGRILDGGATDQGTPYLVMELIEGEPLTDYCDSRSLDLETRLRLFIEVCRGVEHAHSRFVLHRDIKPANVLVGEVDGRPVPKLIDFGIVKLLDAGVEVANAMTRHQLLGTPHYMSPEAIEAAGDLDTRADVFSLGVLLFVMLTGETPWPRGSLADVLRSRSGDEPRRPSTVVSSAAEPLRQETARRRGTTPDKLRQRLRGDLDGIVLRAIAHAPDQRYPSATALADDVERFLADEPTEAHTPTRLDLLRKTFRRHRTVALTITLLIATLSAGVVGTSLGFLRAREQARIAENQTRFAEEQTRVAESALADAEQTSEFLIELFQASTPGRETADLSARELLDRGADKLEESLAEQPVRRAELQKRIAQIYMFWGLHDRAEKLLLVGLEVFEGEHSGTLAHLDQLVKLAQLRRDQRRLVESQEFLEQAFEIDRQLGTVDDGRRAWLLDRLGDVLVIQGQLDEAESHLLEALRLRTEAGDTTDSLMATSNFNVAKLYIQRHQHERALPYQLRAVELFRAAEGSVHPDVAGSLNNLSIIYRALGRLAEAEETSRKSLDLRRKMRPDSPVTANAMGVLGDVFIERGNLEEGLRLRREALEMARRHLPPHNTRLAGMIYSLGRQLLNAGRPAQAEPRLRESLSIYRAAGADAPGSMVSWNLVRLAGVDIALGRPAEGERLAREAREELLASKLPTPLIQGWHAWMIGRALAAQGKVEQARTELQQGLNFFEEAEEADLAAEVREELAALGR